MRFARHHIGGGGESPSFCCSVAIVSPAMNLDRSGSHILATVTVLCLDSLSWAWGLQVLERMP